VEGSTLTPKDGCHSQVHAEEDSNTYVLSNYQKRLDVF
jgi:hypothetical protein